MTSRHPEVDQRLPPIRHDVGLDSEHSFRRATAISSFFLLLSHGRALRPYCAVAGVATAPNLYFVWATCEACSAEPGRGAARPGLLSRRPLG